MSQRTGPRERILAAVTELFVRNGYHGTGIQEISDVVGLGRGALYHHIGSKEQLLFEISMNLLREATESAAPIAETTERADLRLRALARALLRHHAARGDGWEVALRDSRFLSGEHQSELLDARDRFEAVWAGVFAEGAAAGLWRQLDAIELRGVLGMFNSAARWMRAGGRFTPEEIADRYVDLIITGIGRGGACARG
jgi:TetR/AcrR family transcriptional regulator, cholesterol catabolism regulator